MTNYGTLENGIMKPAPRAIRIGGTVVCNPTDAQYEAAGYKRVVDTPPQTDAAHYAVATGWAEQGGEIVRQYEVRELPPPPPRTFSKYRLVAALIQAEVWPQVKEWLLSQDGAYDLYLAAEDISEDEPLLAQGIAAVKQLLGWTDAQVEAVLAVSVI